MYRYPLADGLWLVSIAVLCIVMINIFVLASLLIARLSAEHLEELTELSDDARNTLRRLYEEPERFINTAQFLILFFIVL